MLADRRRDGSHALAGGAELHAALLDVRAGNIHLNHIHVGVGKLLRHGTVILRCVARNVRNHRRALLPQPWKILPDEMIHAGVLQADGVEHARGRLRNARRRVAGTLL